MQETRLNRWVGKTLWRRKWQCPSVFLPGKKSYGQRSLAGYSPGGLKRVRYDLATNQQWLFRFFPTVLAEKAMSPHSRTLAWKIPWMEEPGRLQSMGSLRGRHNWANSLSLFTFMHWRKKWQPTPVFLPGESQGWGSLVGCRLWGRRESDTTEVT